MLMYVQIFKKIILSSALVTLGMNTAMAAGSVKLYTPYTKISVPPGESIDYSIDVKNNDSEIKTMDIYISGMPKGWTYSLKSGGWNVQQLSVLPGEKKTLNLKVEVPLKVNKGNHSFKVVAKTYDELPLVINVSEKGTYKTEFTSEQANMQGHSKASFTFRASIKNQTGEKQLYSLRVNPPMGWTVIFKPNNQQATAVEVEANQNTNVTIEVKPPYNIAAGTYHIPVQAVTNKSSANLGLEVVITGTYEVELTTPNGLLSTSVTAGNGKQIELQINNTGSTDLKNVRLNETCPKNWEVKFEPESIENIAAGKNAKAYATIKSYEKAIPGDYVINLTAQTTETNSKAALRITVKTPLVYGWIGVFIILLTLGSLLFLFRKYGRR